MIPAVQEILKVLNSEWGIHPLEIEPVPTTIRLFRIKIDDRGLMVRVNFGRGNLTAGEVVEFVDYLGKHGCPVPSIFPTLKGELYAFIQDAVVSIESELPGLICDSTRLDVLPSVGRGLAQIHLASQNFHKKPVHLQPLAGYVKRKLGAALARPLQENQHEAVNELYERLTKDYSEEIEIPVQWMITHGDVWGYNVLVHDSTIGFTDINAPFEPNLADVAMVQRKWLRNDRAGMGRPLEVDEMLKFVRGYTSIRPFKQEDLRTFGIIWVAYNADHLTFQAEDLEKRVKDLNRERWDILGEILRLPDLIQRTESFLTRL